MARPPAEDFVDFLTWLECHDTHWLVSTTEDIGWRMLALRWWLYAWFSYVGQEKSLGVMEGGEQQYCVWWRFVVFGG